MSLSVFYAVRFSPAPELGEWLNVAVVGEGITEHKAGVVVADSMDRIEAAFGHDAVDRVADICRDLTSLVAAISKARDNGEETQPITRALRDQALSVSFSEQIMVFEGKFEEALADVAKKYLTADEGIIAPKIEAKAGVKEVGKPLTILVVGSSGILRSALLPRLVAGGNSVRVSEPPVDVTSEEQSAPPTHPTSIQEVAKQAGVTALTVSKVLLGESGAARFSQVTVDRIKEIAHELGIRTGEPAASPTVKNPLSTAMDGVDVVIYLAEAHAPRSTKRAKADSMQKLEAQTRAVAEQAKAHGVKRLLVASTCQVYGNSQQPLNESSALNPETPTGKRSAEAERALQEAATDQIAVTILRLAELYGYSEEARRQVVRGSAERWIELESSVNALAGRVVLGEKVTVTDSERRPYLHVEDAVEAIIGALEAPSEVVGGQIFNVGSEDQIRALTEIAGLIKELSPDAEVVISADAGEGAHCEVVFSKIADHLGFSPARSLEDGIAHLIKALREGANSARQGTGKSQLSTDAETSATPGVLWEKLTYTSVEQITEDNSSTQSIQQHP